MKILYAEDEQIKAKQVIDFLETLYLQDVVLKKSYISTLKELHENKYDLLLLDMSLPLYESNAFYEENFETYAGLDILDEIKRMQVEIKTIIITAFDVLGEEEEMKTLEQLDVEIKKGYADNYLGIVYYNSSSLEWCNRLQELLNL